MANSQLVTLRHMNFMAKPFMEVECISNVELAIFFQIDVSPAATRLASHYDQVVFYNTKTNNFNSIQVKNVYNYSDARSKN